MASDGNVSKNRIVHDDVYTKYRSNTFTRYEKTTSTQEKIDGLWAKRGSSDYQVKIWASGAKAVALFTKQRSYIPEVSGVSDNNYGEDTKSIDVVQGSGFEAHVPLLNGQSVTLGDEVQPTTGGKTAKRTTGQKVGIALKTVSASGADADLLIKVQLEDTKLQITETLSASANSIVLSNIPYHVEIVEITTGTNTPACDLRESGAPAAGEAQIDYSTGKITLSSTDAAVNVFVRYTY